MLSLILFMCTFTLHALPIDNNSTSVKTLDRPLALSYYDSVDNVYKLNKKRENPQVVQVRKLNTKRILIPKKQIPLIERNNEELSVFNEQPMNDKVVSLRDSPIYVPDDEEEIRGNEEESTLKNELNYKAVKHVKLQFADAFDKGHSHVKAKDAFLRSELAVHDKEVVDGFDKERGAGGKEYEQDSDYLEADYGDDDGGKHLQYEEYGDLNDGQNLYKTHIVQNVNEFDKKTEFYDEYEDDGDNEQNKDYVDDYEDTNVDKHKKQKSVDSSKKSAFKEEYDKKQATTFNKHKMNEKKVKKEQFLIMMDDDYEENCNDK